MQNQADKGKQVSITIVSEKKHSDSGLIIGGVHSRGPIRLLSCKGRIDGGVTRSVSCVGPGKSQYDESR